MIQFIEQNGIELLIEHFKNRPKRNLLKSIELNGSARQGSISPSLFNPSCRVNGEKICKEVDVDIQHVHEEELKSQFCLKDVKGKLGIVEIRSQCLTAMKHDRLEYNWTKTEFIQHYWLKELILKRLDRMEEQEMRTFKKVFALYLNSQNRKFKNIDIKLKNIISKATSQKFYEIFVDNKRYLKLNMDLSFVVETKFTPTILKEFGERTSYNFCLLYTSPSPRDS